MAQVECQIENPKAGALTVGQVFILDCKGEWPELNPQSMELLVDKEDQYKLKLISVEWKARDEARLSVTSYQVGEHTLKAVQVVDSEHSVVLGDLKFAVASVMDPEKPVKEPFGPYGPLSLSLSMWYPLSALLLISLIFLSWFLRWRMREQKRKLLADMRLDEYAQAPSALFYQNVRKIQRTYGFFSGHSTSPAEIENFVEEISVAFKIYLARKYMVPTLKWSQRRVLGDLKRNHPSLYEEFRVDLRKAWTELERAQIAVKSSGTESKAPLLAEKDAMQLTDLLRKLVDRIENWEKSTAARTSS